MDKTDIEVLKTEFVDMMKRASAEIKLLRGVIKNLEPRADAWDTMQMVVRVAAPKQGGWSSEDVAWMLDKCIEELTAVKVEEKTTP
jgi:hypothetical protein